MNIHVNTFPGQAHSFSCLLSKMSECFLLFDVNEEALMREVSHSPMRWPLLRAATDSSVTCIRFRVKNSRVLTLVFCRVISAFSQEHFPNLPLPEFSIFLSSERIQKKITDATRQRTIVFVFIA